MTFLGFLLILILVLVNGFFVAAEFALVSVRPSRIEELIKENRPLALITKKAMHKLNDMLSVCQIGITIASIMLGWVGEEFFASIIEPLLVYFQFAVNGMTVHGTATGVAFAGITFMHVILGEMIPKTIAIQKTEQIALGISVPMFAFYYLLFPLTYVMNKLTFLFLQMFGIDDITHKFVHSPEELMIIIEEQSKQGKIDEAEMKFIQNTFEFSENEAKDVMTHRLSIVGIPHDEDLAKILPIIAENHFSRYPVYEKTIDNIIGIIHVHSFLEWLSNPGRDKKAKVTSIMQPPVIIPETQTIEKVLQKLRDAKQHMAIAIDEYGGVSGLLTLEDIVEEVFGQIRDETDDHEVDPVPLTEQNSFSIDGEAELNDLKELLEGVAMEEYEDVRTIAGFILENHEDMPQEGSETEVPSGKFIVEKMDGNKIVSVKYIRSADKSIKLL